jgi:hypothetical protein
MGWRRREGRGRAERDGGGGAGGTTKNRKVATSHRILFLLLLSFFFRYSFYQEYRRARARARRDVHPKIWIDFMRPIFDIRWPFAT